MPLSSVAVGDPVQASLNNRLIAHANGTPGRAIFLSNGLWSVPQGVFQFKVYLCGGGGGRGLDYPFGEGDIGYGGRGGISPLCSKIITGQETGTTFTITIGAAGTQGNNGGTSTFGALLTSNGGYPGQNSSGSGFTFSGDRGSHNGQIAHSNELFLKVGNTSKSWGQGYGTGGIINIDNQDLPAVDGICVIEW